MQICYGGLFQSPHVASLDRTSDTAPLVIILIAVGGVTLSLFSPPNLRSSLAYPISRLGWARIMLYANLVSRCLFLLTLAVCFTALGLLAGWLAGFGLRLDFIPFFVWPLLITVILMPLPQLAGLRLGMGRRSRSGETPRRGDLRSGWIHRPGLDRHSAPA